MKLFTNKYFNLIHKKGKYITNRIARLLTVIPDGNVSKALKVLTFYSSLSTDWNTIKPDTEEFYL